MFTRQMMDDRLAQTGSVFQLLMLCLSSFSPLSRGHLRVHMIIFFSLSDFVRSKIYLHPPSINTARLLGEILTQSSLQEVRRDIFYSPVVVFELGRVECQLRINCPGIVLFMSYRSVIEPIG